LLPALCKYPFTFNQNFSPNPAKYISRNKHGFKICLWNMRLIKCYILVNLSGASVYPYNSQNSPVFQEAADNDYFIREVQWKRLAVRCVHCRAHQLSILLDGTSGSRDGYRERDRIKMFTHGINPSLWYQWTWVWTRSR